MLRPRSQTPPGERNRWRTPPVEYARLAARYGPYDLDAAADETNHLCPRWLGPGSPIATDALTVPWSGRVWCNPPYDQIPAFVAHAAASEARTTLLLPAFTDARWWHDWVWHLDRPRPGVTVEFLRRVRFLRPDRRPGTNPFFGSVAVVFGV